ncbi:MAG: leucine-rich repeat protein, partial [Spirochaetia bacterium]|nr:leucine-rich repeat protein [Spirochaetia bacterium]
MKKIVIFLSLIFFIFLTSCDDGGHQSGENGDNNDNVKNENIFITQAQGNGVLITGLLEKGKLLSDISVPETIDGKSVIGIKSGAFAGCTNLVRITLAKSIESIGANAFSGCTGLESITVKSTPPPALEAGAFDGCTAVFFVPAGYKGTYANSHIWKDYAARIFESDAIFIYSISSDRV